MAEATADAEGIVEPKEVDVALNRMRKRDGGAEQLLARPADVRTRRDAMRDAEVLIEPKVEAEDRSLKEKRPEEQADVTIADQRAMLIFAVFDDERRHSHAPVYVNGIMSC